MERGESVPAGIRRIACEQLEGAIRSLGRARGRDEAIHDARKRLKKTRALLRLVRPYVGRVYAEENGRLRDAGRVLSEFRDAAVVIETFDELRAKFPAEFAGGSLAGVRRLLKRRKAQIERSGAIRRTLAEVSSQLAAAARRVNRWPLAIDGFDGIGPGLKRTFRRGRKAMAAARRGPTSENFHEWRKRVKAHWYHVRLLEALWDKEMKSREADLKQLEDWLGIDHNLEVLREKAGGHAGALLPMIDRYQEELRARALEIGDSLYRYLPRQFRRGVEELWQAWSDSETETAKPAALRKPAADPKPRASRDGCSANSPSPARSASAARR